MQHDKPSPCLVSGALNNLAKQEMMGKNLDDMEDMEATIEQTNKPTVVIT